MKSKVLERQLAIRYRKQGLSYGEILKLVSVSKSSLSSWLSKIDLDSRSKSLLFEKKRLAQLKGGEVKHQQRLDKIKLIKEKTINEFGKLSLRELHLIGSALYWAEGTKQKESNVSQQVVFSNSDLLMVRLFNRWLKEVCKVKDNEIQLDLYIHESADIIKAKHFWAESLKIDELMIRVYLKKHRITNRKNVKDYHGLIRISVKKSTDLNRQISGWIDAITMN